MLILEQDFKATIQEHRRTSRGVIRSLNLVDEESKPFGAETWERLRQEREKICVRLRALEDNEESDSESDDAQDESSDTSEAVQGDRDFPDLPRHTTVPPFLSWNALGADASDSTNMSLVEITKTLDYIEQNFGRSTQLLQDILVQVGWTLAREFNRYDSLDEADDSTYLELRAKIQSFSQSRGSQRSISISDSLSPESLRKSVESLVVEVFQGTRYFLDTFTPNLDHPSMHKIYGAILSIVTVNQATSRCANIMICEPADNIKRL
jgi:hypothetical protein